MFNSENGKVAYMEEADEDDFPRGPRTYAGSVAPSPTKEKPNTDSTLDPTALIPRRESKAKPREKDRAANKKAALVRPPTKHAKTSPVVQFSAPRRSVRDEASYYAADPTMVTPAQTSRPRAHTTRPASYYGPSSRPPLANARYYTQPPPVAPPPPPQMLPTSYPPQSWAGAGGVSYPLGPAPPQRAPQGPPPDYFGRQHMQLANRFSRPASAMGHRAPPPSATVHYPNDYEDDDDESESESEEEAAPVQRRTSLRAMTNAQEDRMRMPPPQRPMSARPLTLRSSPFAPPPPQKFDDEAFEGESSLYHDVSPFQGPLVHRTRRPSMSGRGTPGPYEVAPYSTEIATTGSRRSSGYFGNPPPPSSSKLEERLRRASTYQENISGGASMRLTAESLKKATRQALASSHSTGSSESLEESDWRQSATTRTTRSSNNNNDEDVTIRVKGSAVLKVGGAEMKCADGAEINISSSRLPPGMRSSSDKSSYADFEDRRARMERPATRTRASSQAGSHSRMLPRLDAPPAMYHYDYPQSARYPPPPAPAPYYNYPNYI